MKSPYWLAENLPKFPRVTKSGKYDVVVVGGGLTGITTAYLLKKAGRTVALVERDRFAQVDTGHTTAHVTQVTDLRLTKLVKHFGEDHARAVWDAGRAAIHEIDSIVADAELECEFRHVPGFLHASLESTKDESKKLREEAELAQKLGFDAAFLDCVPFMDRPGIRFANQALFHPLKYLSGLLQRIPGDGSHAYEHSEATEFHDQPLGLTVNGRRLECDYLVIATHVPLMGNAGLPSATLFQTKLAPYSSYAIGADVPQGAIPEASFWDTSDPYYYLRVEKGARKDYAIFGGADHKTGQVTATDERFAALEAKLLELVPAGQSQPPLVRASDRNDRRSALHRRDGRAAIRCHGFLRQRNDFWHSRGDHGPRRSYRAKEPLARAVQRQQKKTPRRHLGLCQGKLRLPVLHAQGSLEVDRGGSH